MTTKCFVIGTEYEFKNIHEETGTWSTNMLDKTYPTYEAAVEAAQKKADGNKENTIVFSAVALVKYPTPSFPVEQIS